MSTDRTRAPNPIRAALQSAMLSPKVQAAAMTFVNALVDEGEAVLRDRYGGDRLRMYVPKSGGRGVRDERRLRVQALAGAPTNLTPEAIAPLVGLSVRHVRRLLATGSRT
jgi:hypothetical protein